MIHYYIILYYIILPYNIIITCIGLQGENMDAANTLAVVTMLATVVCLPVALLIDGPKIQVPITTIRSYISIII